MKYHVINTSDPFEFDKEMHREEVARLTAEIFRLKHKCGEDVTEREMLVGFGYPPDMYIPRAVVERRRKQNMENGTHWPLPD